MNIESEYRERLRQRRQTLAGRERVHARYAFARVVLFLVIVAIAIVGGVPAATWLIAPVVAFAVLAAGHARLLNLRDRAASAVAFYERGLARVTYQWIGHGRDGRHLAPEHHLYAEDLDIFGRGSLFELLATTRTHAGEETLARWLLAPAGPDVVRARQDAVRELAGRLDLRERVAVMGDALGIGVHAKVLRAWAGTPIALRSAAVRIGLAVLVASTVGTLLWWWWNGGVPGSIVALLIVAQMVIAQVYKKRVLPVIEAVDEPAHDLELLADLLRTIETEPMTAARLRALQAAVARSGRPASAEIGQLSRMIGWLSARHNVYFAIPAGLLMWATQWAFAIEAWRSRAGVHIPEWLDVVGEFEALLALATYAAEHPDEAVFPTMDADGALIAAVDLKHPTLPASAIGNSVAIGGSAPQLLIVSGSNMSGKSTLLRSLGANAVLAQMGAPVRAAAFRMAPLDIGAAIRVQDSLVDGRSRFMAEITRLKAIVDLTAARQGAVLFLLDEILGGTNSHDRRIGSEALLAGLVASGAVGLVTTHDLALADIATRLPGRADNVHFVDRFEDGELAFDYRLRPGIVQTSNALALMRSIGLDV